VSGESKVGDDSERLLDKTASRKDGR